MSEESIDGSVKPEGNYGAPPATAVGALSGKKVIYISNNLDYIVPLEYGHSGQAPQGMAAIALAEVMGRTKSIGFKVKPPWLIKTKANQAPHK